ncbi:23S rRNA (pseudouridine(1915)-N(3))-methyltransferase RlmH [Bacillus mangrovi]|uniref:Ribosomal RNA large subunit methyltransferase H n=1 Tax=Metabacillus mangrovi TaxID=1491830 RepID=A0A7X2S5P4_9BACI|nr:23S rRNA (pseudouridine(1915)-N(3))-methyltransferase RlmH [Metabacillus mangrovi]
MNITIITVGKLKEKYLKQGIDEYLKRLSAYAKMDIIELPDEKAPENLSDLDMKIVKDKEGERILGKISDDTHVIALAIEGKMKSSEQLASDLDRLATYGKSKVAFVIGGSLGLSDGVMKRANDTLSFSKMTFPHQLMRLILVEQVYRAFRIVRGEPYHK